jgi:hypothetical protein
MVTFADEVRSRLTELDRPRLARFAVACATRMEPVFTTFWRSTRPEAYRNWIDELWSNVDELSADLAESVAESVMETPESMVDDSNRPDYYAMRVLGSVVYAAQTMTDDDPSRLRCQPRVRPCPYSATSTMRWRVVIGRSPTQSSPRSVQISSDW